MGILFILVFVLGIVWFGDLFVGFGRCWVSVLVMVLLIAGVGCQCLRWVDVWLWIWFRLLFGMRIIYFRIDGWCGFVGLLVIRELVWFG